MSDTRFVNQRTVGTSVLPDEAIPLVEGEGRFLNDIRLPGMDGVEFAEKVRTELRMDVPLAFVSAFEGPPTTVSPPVAYFAKPFDVDALVDWVSSVCQADRDG